MRSYRWALLALGQLLQLQESGLGTFSCLDASGARDRPWFHAKETAILSFTQKRELEQTLLGTYVEISVQLEKFLWGLP
jgi:hypothetical protein